MEVNHERTEVNIEHERAFFQHISKEMSSLDREAETIMIKWRLEDQLFQKMFGKTNLPRIKSRKFINKNRRSKTQFKRRNNRLSPLKPGINKIDEHQDKENLLRLNMRKIDEEKHKKLNSGSWDSKNQEIVDSEVKLELYKNKHTENQIKQKLMQELGLQDFQNLASNGDSVERGQGVLHSSTSKDLGSEGFLSEAEKLDLERELNELVGLLI